MGPLSQPLWATAHSVPSTYNDTFDYGIYDRLHERFGDRQPRGGVVYKGTMKLLETQDCAQCYHRFEIDTYGRGCVHNCAYCYAKSYLSIRRYWNEPIPFPIDIAAIRKIFATVFETSKKNKFRHILERRIPLRLGSMSGAFMWIDKKYRVTLELLKILRFYAYPYIIQCARSTSLPALLRCRDGLLLHQNPCVVHCPWPAFSTCYIGNDPLGESFAHYQHLWNNRADCCAAVGNVQAFKTTCAALPRGRLRATHTPADTPDA
jgi:hypothetical protein